MLFTLFLIWSSLMRLSPAYAQEAEIEKQEQSTVLIDLEAQIQRLEITVKACNNDSDCIVAVRPQCHAGGCHPGPCGHVHQDGELVALNKTQSQAYLDLLLSRESEVCNNVNCLACAQEEDWKGEYIPLLDGCFAVCMGSQCVVQRK
jgi:hypothetical protein